MKKYVMVEAISQFRQRYVIEVPDDHDKGDFPCSSIEWAEDTVTMEQMTEFSQKWLGETIIGSREVTKEEILRICDEDNEYCKSWTDDHKFDTFVTPIGYEREL
jgi:hypothetical protein